MYPDDTIYLQIHLADAPKKFLKSLRSVRVSVDGRSLIYGCKWNRDTLLSLQNIPSTLTLTHAEAMNKIGQQDWKIPLDKIKFSNPRYIELLIRLSNLQHMNLN